MVAPAKTPEKCSLQMMDAELGSPLKAELAKSLFAQQSVKGWWPCSIEKDGKKVLAVSLNTLFGPVIHLLRLKKCLWCQKQHSCLECVFNVYM